MSAEDRDKIEEQLSAYLDGELDAPQRVRLEQHLASDPQLRRALDELKATVAAVRQLPRESCPHGLKDATLAMLEREMLLGPAGTEPADMSGRPRRVMRWLATAAVVGLATTAGYLTLQKSRVGQTDVSPSIGQIAMLGDQEEPSAPKADKDTTVQRKSGTVRPRLGGASTSKEMSAPMPTVRARGERGRAVSQGEKEPRREAGFRRDEVDVSTVRGAGAGGSDEKADAASPRVAQTFAGKSQGEGPGVAPAEEPEAAERTDSRVARLADEKAPAWVRALRSLNDKLSRLSAPQPDAVAVTEATPSERGPVVADEGAAKRRPGPLPDAMHAVRLVVETSSPAGVYAMTARARTFVINERLEPVTPEPKSRRTPEEKQAHPRTIDKSERRKFSEDAVVQTVTFRGRRSQLVDLLKDLKLQDSRARVQLFSERTSASGWDQASLAAANIGVIRVSALSPPVPDFTTAPSLTIGGEPSRPPSADRGDRSVRGSIAPSQRATPSSKKERRYGRENQGAQMAAPAVQPPRNAGAKKRGVTAALGEAASRPAAATSDQLQQPPGGHVQESPSPWVNEFLGLLSRPVQVMVPDPTVEVTLKVYCPRDAGPREKTKSEAAHPPPQE